MRDSRSIQLRAIVSEPPCVSTRNPQMRDSVASLGVSRCLQLRDGSLHLLGVRRFRQDLQVLSEMLQTAGAVALCHQNGSQQKLRARNLVSVIELSGAASVG